MRNVFLSKRRRVAVIHLEIVDDGTERTEIIALSRHSQCAGAPGVL